jgi:demethylmenaquinone methyltransferase/2-methoxy-6-polyprenyl-1,4-benzoquinol methylase
MPVDKSGERIQQMFGEIAPRYDLMNHVLSLGIDYYWRWRTVKALPLIPEVPVLDVCTGTGDLAIAYWNEGGGKVPVTGSDFTHEMLCYAHQKKTKLDAKMSAHIDFIEADSMQLPFASNTFQLVSVAFGLRNIADTGRGLNEMIRVCKPEGHVVILEFSKPDIPVIGSMYQWYFKNVLPRIGQLFAKNRQSAYNYLPQSVAEFPQGKEMLEILNKHGLTETKCISLTLGVASLYIGKKSNMSKHSTDHSTMAKINYNSPIIENHLAEEAAI